MTAANPAQRQITGKHVLITLCAFFGVMFAVNGVFAYFAVSTFNGIETSDAYRKGLNYNEQLTVEAERLKQGWKTKIVVRPELQSLSVAIKDQAGYPIAGLQLQADMGRPATDKFDRQITFAETDPGLYAAALKQMDAGTWILALSAKRETSAGSQAVYEHKERIWLAPRN